MIEEAVVITLILGLGGAVVFGILEVPLPTIANLRRWRIVRAHRKAVERRALELLAENPERRYKHKYSRCDSFDRCIWCSAEHELATERAAINRVIRESLT